VTQARAWLEAASSVVVLTGAGISAESGVPTFRGQGGLWKKFRAEDLATPEAFTRDPRLVWEWYDSRRAARAQVAPNAGHRALAELEARKPQFTLVTQNVDGLHDRAGIWTQESGDRSQETGVGSERRDERTPLPELPPCCECGGMLRPGVVWFGEPLPAAVWERAQKATREAEVLLVVGTSATVYPAAGLVPLAMSAGARVIECNVEETPFSSGLDRSLRGRAGEVLPQLIA